MNDYHKLVTSDEIRNRFGTIVSEEFNSTNTLLATILGGNAQGLRPRLARTIALRAEPLRVLHLQQIALLNQFRSMNDEPVKPGAMGKDQVLAQLLLTVNAIASGLRTTG